MQHAKLWKRILNEGLVYDCEDSQPEKLEPDIIKSTIILDGRTGEIGRHVDWHSIHGVAIPLEMQWIEGAFDNNILWGALIDTQKIPGEGWLIQSWCVTAGGIPTCFGHARVAFDQSGNLLRNAETGKIKASIGLSPHCVKENGREAVSMTVSSVLYAALDVLLLLSCKNVSLAPRDNDPKQVRRAIKRHGGTPDSYRYHTLVVRPPGAKSNAPTQEIGIMPRHLCRGHYQHYGPAADHGHPDGKDRGLLFGKYSGKFYMPPIYKGDKKNGVVEKDYVVG